MRKKKLTRRASKAVFAAGKSTKTKNLVSRPMRGGIRL